VPPPPPCKKHPRPCRTCDLPHVAGRLEDAGVLEDEGGGAADAGPAGGRGAAGGGLGTGAWGRRGRRPHDLARWAAARRGPPTRHPVQPWPWRRLCCRQTPHLARMSLTSGTVGSSTPLTNCRDAASQVMRFRSTARRGVGRAPAVNARAPAGAYRARDARSAGGCCCASPPGSVWPFASPGRCNERRPHCAPGAPHWMKDCGCRGFHRPATRCWLRELSMVDRTAQSPKGRQGTAVTCKLLPTELLCGRALCFRLGTSTRDLRGACLWLPRHNVLWQRGPGIAQAHVSTDQGSSAVRTGRN